MGPSSRHHKLGKIFVENGKRIHVCVHCLSYFHLKCSPSAYTHQPVVVSQLLWHGIDDGENHFLANSKEGKDKYLISFIFVCVCVRCEYGTWHIALLNTTFYYIIRVHRRLYTHQFVLNTHVRLDCSIIIPIQWNGYSFSSRFQFNICYCKLDTCFSLIIWGSMWIVWWSWSGIRISNFCYRATRFQT